MLLLTLALLQIGSPAGPVPTDLLKARRNALMERIGTGVAVLQGASERQSEPPDADYPQDSDFRQDSDFFYLTGLEVPESWLVLVARSSGPDQAILFLPPREPEKERWLGARMGPGPEAAAAAGLGARDVRSTADMAKVLDSLVNGADSPAKTGGIWAKRNGRTAGSEVLQALISKASKAHDLLPALADLRQVKDADELRRLKRAAEISAAGHVSAIKAAHVGAWEYEVEAAAEYEFRRLGAERVGYPSIVGAGANSTVLHYDESRAQLKDGDLVVMDMAAEFGYYTADVTRTLPANGKFSARQRAVYDLVLASQQAAMDAVKPGITMAQLDGIARRYMRDHSGTTCGRRTCDTYFIHSLGHYIGMDVHDVGSYEVALAPGMVLTLEPGIYIPEEGLGVRIEDDVVVTANGYELLTGGVPRTAEGVEALMRKP
jgi:Xaa-Pro aminopeptidase